MKKIRYFIYCCLLFLLLYGEGGIAQEKSGTGKCHLTMLLLPSSDRCLGIKTWGGIQRSSHIIRGEEIIKGENLDQEDSSTIWDINIGFQKTKLGSLPLFERLPILQEGWIFENLEFDTYFTYGNNYKIKRLPGDDNILKTNELERTTSFRKTYGLRFSIPTF